MRILLFCDFELPDSCAAASRIINFYRMLSMCSYDVDLLGVNYSGKNTFTEGYKGIAYKMIDAPKLYGIKSGKRNKIVEKEIKEYLCGQEKYDVIILSNVYYDFSKCFIDYSKKNSTALVVNAVEWYDFNNDRFAGLFGFIKFVKNRIALKVIHKQMGNIIAISSLLEDYYKDRGCLTIRIPTIIDFDDFNCSEYSRNEKVIISYAGNPAKKDYIGNAVKSLAFLSDEERNKVELHFYGATRESLLWLGISESYLDENKEIVFVHGKIPSGEVGEVIAKSDYTILLRPNKRYANAGFPTKVGESMACGTPVIANITSDLDKYIIDGQTGLVCSDETPESCAIAIKRAIELFGTQEYLEMRKNAHKMAKLSFDFERYVSNLDAFLQEVFRNAN